MVVMRLTDVQLTVPSILMALLVDGIARGLISREMHDEMAIYVLIFAIGISEWPQFARVSRAATLVEKNKDYVSASTIIGVSNLIIMFKHILPNILRPVISHWHYWSSTCNHSRINFKFFRSRSSSYYPISWNTH